MDSKVALLLGFLIGVAAGIGGMVLTGLRDKPHVVPPVVTNVAAKGIVEAAREKNSHGPNWWGMDAPTPDIGPVYDTRPPDRIVTNIVTGEISTNRNPWRGDWEQLTQQEREQRFVSFWTNQAAVARTTFITNAALDADQATRFDVLTAAMNLRLAAKLDPLVEQYQKGWRPNPEDRTRIALDVSSVLVGTYDEMDRNMPENWRDTTTNSGGMSLTQFVDPKYMPFMRGIGGIGGRPGGWGVPQGGPPPTPPR